MDYFFSEKLKQIKQALIVKDIVQLRAISNQLIEQAALQRNPLIVKTSLISYALSKFLSKEHISDSPNLEKMINSIISDCDSCETYLVNNDMHKFEETSNLIVSHVMEIDHELGNYITNIMDKARLKQASRAYSYGLSLKSAAQLTNVNEKELFSYIGITKMHDEIVSKKGISARLRELEAML